MMLLKLFGILFCKIEKFLHEKISVLLVFLILSATGFATTKNPDEVFLHNGIIDLANNQQQDKKISGIVQDQNGEPVIGASVIVKGTTIGVATGLDGSYTLDVKQGNTIVVSYIGMESYEFVVGNETTINVKLKESGEMLEEVAVVAFAKQKKSSMVASISTVNTADLKIPSSNLTTSLAGRVAGLISYQTGGEPGLDDATFFVRGVTSFSYAKGPLIVIDGVEAETSDLSQMQPDDIASFSILKDATATALYGARGGNGVILITSKEGSSGPARISFRYETSVSQPTDKVELADPITYMKLNNEAVTTRNPMATLQYSLAKIEGTERNLNPYAFPQNDWYNMLLKDNTINHRFNFNLNGGGKVANYYIAATYNRDNGNLKVDKRNNFNNNVAVSKYSLRSNVNITVTPTTEVKIKLNGNFQDYSGPIDGGSDVYESIMESDPAEFPAYYPAETAGTFKNRLHILFGNSKNGNYRNPYSDMVRGYKENSKSTMLIQAEVYQNLKMITDGLKIRGLFNANRYSYYDVSRSYIPYFYHADQYDPISDTYVLTNPYQGRDYLILFPGNRNITSSTYFEGAINYDKIFDHVHAVSGLLVGNMRNEMEVSEKTYTISKSLPRRNIGISGRFTYGYDDRYLMEFNFGYNGSERFASSNRFGFFPSVGLAWNATKEHFWNRDLAKIISNLKLRITYGLAGNDEIGDKDDRFFYLSVVDMAGNGYNWGLNGEGGASGVSISKYANENITWQISKKFNFGIELGLFNSLDVNVDLFKEEVSNILQDRQDIPITMGFQASQRANIGVSTAEGVDFSLDYKKAFTSDFWLQGRANVTYSVTKYKEYEEVDNTNTPWLSRIGQPIGQQWGYIAERLFVDDEEVKNSPKQTFGEYGGGDIKYRDINGDDIINSLDEVPLGYSDYPNIVYGFGISAGYKGFDFSSFFQGLGHRSLWIDPGKTAPFGGSRSALLKAYADSHWSESNKDIYALWPRLSNYNIENNRKRSTWFLRDGSFMRLKSLELGYTLPSKLMKKIRVNNLRLYLSGSNLLTFSKFKLWDPELGGEGFKYPIQRVFNLGLQLTL